jgi:hypothetical protein
MNEKSGYVKKRKQRKSKYANTDKKTGYRIDSPKHKAFELWVKGYTREQIVLALANDIKKNSVYSYCFEFQKLWSHLRGSTAQSVRADESKDMSVDTFLSMQADRLKSVYDEMATDAVITLRDGVLDRGDIWMELCIRGIV